MECVRDVNGSEYRTDRLYTLEDLWEMFQDGELGKGFFERALCDSIEFVRENRGISYNIYEIGDLSDIMEYHGICFTNLGSMVELADEPPYEKGE